MKADTPIVLHKDLEICIGKKNQFPNEVIALRRKKKTEQQYIQELKEAKVGMFYVHHHTPVKPLLMEGLKWMIELKCFFLVSRFKKRI